jgi:DNA helicase-2/ATP-dependent DNA helicase PcrA
MNRKEKIEVLARSVCKKPPALPPTECHETIGAGNPLCNESESCRISQQSDEQLNYVLSRTGNCTFLRACPGSGKTEVVGLKAAFEMSKWSSPQGGIAVVTFTKNAASVIEKRVNQFGGTIKIGFPHFIGTIDSWLHGYIGNPFAHKITGYEGVEGDCSLRLVDVSSRAGFLHAFEAKYTLGKTGNPFANQYYFDTQIGGIYFTSGNRGVDSERNGFKLEDWRLKDLMEKKRKFAEAGFATYQDIENICLYLLTNLPRLARLCSLRFPLIIVDECQDLSWIQIQILECLRAHNTALHFVGDLHQAIYEFKKVAPEIVADYVQTHTFVEMSLSSNYRSCQDISNLCSALVKTDDKIVSLCERLHDSALICVTYSKEEIGALPRWFREFLGGLGIDSQHSVVVTRSWANVSRMRPANNGNVANYQERLAMALFLWNCNSPQATDEALRLFGQFVGEKYFPKQQIFALEYYRPKAISSALRWRLFLARALTRCCEDKQLMNFDLTWSDWSYVVREKTHEYLRSCAYALPDCPEVEFLPLVSQNKRGTRQSFPIFSSPRRQGDRRVSAILTTEYSEKTSLRITTVHNVKGETFSALMLVSSIDTRGTRDGHWTFWLENPASEAARLAYVASSRPQQLLVWAIPDPSEADKKRLTDYGFNIVALT